MLNLLTDISIVFYIFCNEFSLNKQFQNHVSNRLNNGNSVENPSFHLLEVKFY